MDAEQPRDDQSSTGAAEDPAPSGVVPPPERYDLKIVSALRRIVHANDVYSRKLKTQYQTTVPQLVCLLEITEAGPLKISEVARRVFLSASTVVGIIDRLEERGLITRQRDSVDRRQVRVGATTAGLKLVRQAPSPLQDGIANALARLPELEQATIALSLERVVELMEATPFAEEIDNSTADTKDEPKSRNGSANTGPPSTLNGGSGDRLQEPTMGTA